MSLIRSLLAATGLMLATALAHAEDSASGAIATPARGITMAQVEKEFGPPKQVVPAVGEPPITRWIYDTYTVYFENDRVLHSVSNEKKPPAP